MSWSTSGTIVDGDLNVLPLTEQPAEVIDALETASAAVYELYESGAVGARDLEYTVSLSGHANPGHVPKAGWSNDFISISLYQKTVPEDDGA